MQDQTTRRPQLLDRCTLCDRDAQEVVDGKPLCASHAAAALQKKDQ